MTIWLTQSGKNFQNFIFQNKGSQVGLVNGWSCLNVLMQLCACVCIYRCYMAYTMLIFYKHGQSKWATVRWVHVICIWVWMSVWTLLCLCLLLNRAVILSFIWCNPYLSCKVTYVDITFNYRASSGKIVTPREIKYHMYPCVIEKTSV